MMEEKHQTESTYASFPRLPQTAREMFDVLPPLPGFRVEVIEGKFLMSPMGNPEHTWLAADLHDALLPLRRERGWRGSPGGPSICIEGPRDSLEPDYVLAPSDCPRWGKWELQSSGVLMAAEVVSPSSVDIDYKEKVRLYALGRVPVYLLIDPIADEPAVTVFSEIKNGAYQVRNTTLIGTPIKLPAPIDFELDTSIFKV
ncbi:Uma2 family endonuclease [Nonomuraea sp. NPDC049400]|uniref:Uma2 family endonuclease n=1 Tax=Nonomuraea sp. NPDC049400 TaxID=3364352 RepID=UPI0037888C4A